MRRLIPAKEIVSQLDLTPHNPLFVISDKITIQIGAEADIFIEEPVDGNFLIIAG